MKKYILFTFLFILITSSVTTAEQNISVVGSNTVFPIMDAAAARYQEINPDISIELSGPGSGAGIKALIDGQTDLAPMSRAPKDSEIADATAKGMSIVKKTVGIDAIVIIINKKNPIVNLNNDQITGIFNGTIRKWSELGWTNALTDLIKIAERDEKSGTHDYFNEEFLNGKEVPADTKLQGYHSQFASTKALFELVASEDNAIGYGGLAYYDASIVKAVTVNGIVANKADAKDGSYGISRPLFVVYDENSVSQIALDFVNYVLSPEGQFIVEDVGYVAIGTIATGLSDIATANNKAPFPTLAVFATLTIVIFVKKIRIYSK